MIEIRLIREADAPAFRLALDAVCRERRYLAALEAPPLAGVRTFVADNVERGWPHFVAVEGETVVGWCDALPGSSSQGGAHVGRLGMGVIQSHRGRGLGRRLLEATIRKARDIGLEKIELGVFGTNQPAIALYHKLGFIEEGRKRRARLVDGIYDDIVLLALPLR